MPPTPDSTTSAPIAALMLPLLIRAARAHGHLTITVVDNINELAVASGLPELPAGYCGLTDRGSGHIYLDANGSDNELRATITHELGHLVDPHATEEEIEMRTAELLIPLPDAMHAHNTGDHETVADHCHVDTALVRTRVRGLVDAPTVRLPVQRSAGPNLEAVAG